jgi:hypothetical protein
MRECFLFLNIGIAIEPSFIPSATLFNPHALRFSTVVCSLSPTLGFFNRAAENDKLRSPDGSPSYASGDAGYFGGPATKVYTILECCFVLEQ